MGLYILMIINAFLFLNEKINEVERRAVLAHEEGQYYYVRIYFRNVVDHKVVEEQEANELSHYLLRSTIRRHI